jgi:hypothetical protein
MVVNFFKNHTNKIFGMWSNRMTTNNKRIETISNKNDKGEIKNTQYLFTQFGPTMIFSGGETSFSFHYINEFGYNEILKVITRINQS